MDFRTLKPQAGGGDADAIKTVLGVMRVAKVKAASKVRRSSSSGSLGGQLALQDGSPEHIPSAGASSSGMEEVVNLEKSFQALRSLQDEVEAQT